MDVAAPEIARTTLCLASTRDHALSARAAQHCAASCRFERRIYFSDRAWEIEGFGWHAVAAFDSLADYNRLMLRGLVEHIETEFVLVAQFDGFVADPRCWSDDFLEWDYVGAPWPQHAVAAVGNGGFSLRSRRLLEALRDLAEDPGEAAEDTAICRLWRPVLEARYGIRFAPTEVARRFSHEAGRCPGRTFGVHGLYHLNRLYRGPEVDWLAGNLAEEQFGNWRLMALVLAYLREGAEDAASTLFAAICRRRGLDEIDRTLAALRASDEELAVLFAAIPA